MIKNLNDDTNFKLACCNCGTNACLMQVAHRNKERHIIGYLFVCLACMPIVSGKYRVQLQEDK